VLLGRFGDDGAKTVSRVARCGNTRDDSPHNRYHIDPKELIRIQREGRERGEEIVGFYHSHPDHPARWSVTVCEQTMGKWLRQLGMTRLQPRPYHPKKDLEAEVAFKKTSPAW